MAPRVSVIMAACNAERTLGRAVRSVLAQTVTNLELLVCDDGSVDGTGALLAAIDDPRLRVLHNSDNQGPGPSRDRAIAAAAGGWLAVIDADDAWLPSRLEVLLAAAPNGADTLVFDDLMVCHDTPSGLVPWRRLHGAHAFGDVSRSARPIALEDYLTAERLLIKPMFPAALVKSRGITHSTRRFAEDTEFFIALAGAGARFLYVPEALYLYAVTPGSLTALASDRTSMRRCLLDWATRGNWTETVQLAFARKIAALEVNEAMHDLAESLARGNLRSAWRRLRECPAVLRVLPRRLLRQLVYQTHRIRHGGTRR